jgi:hypothetical protein
MKHSPQFLPLRKIRDQAVCSGANKARPLFGIHPEAPQFVTGNADGNAAAPRGFTHFHRPIAKSYELPGTPACFIENAFDNHLFGILGNFADGTVNPAIEDIRVPANPALVAPECPSILQPAHQPFPAALRVKTALPMIPVTWPVRTDTCS